MVVSSHLNLFFLNHLSGVPRGRGLSCPSCLALSSTSDLIQRLLSCRLLSCLFFTTNSDVLLDLFELVLKHDTQVRGLPPLK